MRTRPTLRTLVLGLAVAGLATTSAACSSELVSPSGSTDVAGGSSGGNSGGSADDNGGSADDNGGSTIAVLRVRCEIRGGRSKISVDANNLSPQSGEFRARVNAAGGTVTSSVLRAVGDEVEFDFDSNRDDIAAGATAISPSFVVQRDGPDVVGELLSPDGAVVGSQAAECEVR